MQYFGSAILSLNRHLNSGSNHFDNPLSVTLQKIPLAHQESLDYCCFAFTYAQPHPQPFTLYVVYGEQVKYAGMGQGFNSLIK